MRDGGSCQIDRWAEVQWTQPTIRLDQHNQTTRHINQYPPRISTRQTSTLTTSTRGRSIMKYIEYTHNIISIKFFFSSPMALQLWSSLGLLYNILQFKAVLDLFCPLYKLHLLQVIPDIVFPTGLGLSCWFTCEYIHTLPSIFTADCICSHKYSLLSQDAAK